MCLIPRQGIIVKGIAFVQILRCICIEQMVHQENVIDIFLIENRKVMHFLFIREHGPDRMEGLSSFTNLHDYKEL